MLITIKEVAALLLLQLAMSDYFRSKGEVNETVGIAEAATAN